MTNSQILEKKLDILLTNLRYEQKQLAHWKSGKMSVTAVPGAGKSHSLATTAAILIARNNLNINKQLVIVTYTRSAAMAIEAKIKQHLIDLDISQDGFMVNTLHGLALQIINNHPNFSKLNLTNSTLINLTPNHKIIENSIDKWIDNNPLHYQSLLKGVVINESRTEQLRRKSILRNEIFPRFAYSIIREIKSSGLTLKDFEKINDRKHDNYQTLLLAVSLYKQYKTVMKSSNFIDYDDMIHEAINILDDSDIRQVWQQKVFAVFEDEAQDSSPLQEKLISTLASDHNNPTFEVNLVKVGDPNQAINSTFTAADPIYFNWFCEACKKDKTLVKMNQAGRSNIDIINAANFSLKWMRDEWIKKQTNLKNSFSEQQTLEKNIPFHVQEIKLVDKNDPQVNANPQSSNPGLEIHIPQDIYHSIKLIRQKIITILRKNRNQSIAILVRENTQSHFLAQNLKDFPEKYKISIYEVGKQNQFSQIPKDILTLLKFMDRPHSLSYLKNSLKILEKQNLIIKQDWNKIIMNPEDFLYSTSLLSEPEKSVIQARNYCRSLLKAKLELPSYYLIAFLGTILKYESMELASVQKLSDTIYDELNGTITLKNIIDVLKKIIDLEQFEEITEDNEQPYVRPNQVTIMTMHKSKGLDWNYVFLPFLHEDILSGEIKISATSKFLGNFSLAEIARTQIRALSHEKYLSYENNICTNEIKQVWEQSKLLKKAEEYRLIYVAITRAKNLLWMSAAQKGPSYWRNIKEKVFLQNKAPCLIFSALMNKFPHLVVRH
ncbi:ATP-dependent helicase [Candidatus Atelocyanobacterium thalassa]|uniref:ATP-dependent helicase n=1 Tax=Candidatus Atelocyanobacterium thalassae TaxID=713887 RepID=UPI00059C53C5|nr:ATP-dependent helicase [Candidatus Atelocyanobacterium thalassa]